MLDVGGARPEAAAALRAAGVREIVAIVPSAANVESTSGGYDRVVAAPLADVREPWDEFFDAILFGGVLERLADPSDALARVRPWLRPGGRVIASVSHAGAAVIGELLEERFTRPAPWRFFTRRSVADLFEASGYSVESIEGIAEAPPPAGLDELAAVAGASADLAVREWVVVARSADGHYDDPA